VKTKVSKKRRGFHVNHECRTFQVTLCTVTWRTIFFTTEGRTFDKLSVSLTKTVGNKAESHRQTNTLRSTKLSANPVTSESEYTKGWTNEESWLYYRQRQEYCSSPVCQTCSGAHRISSSLTNGDKRPRHKGDSSSQSSAEIKCAWSYISTHP
jgi:hypothetical protein